MNDAVKVVMEYFEEPSYKTFFFLRDLIVCHAACQCYGHASDCIFDEEVERQRRSIDIHGVFEGGGVCQNCQVRTIE